MCLDRYQKPELVNIIFELRRHNMSKGLSQMTSEERKAAIARRKAEKKGGLGYLAALDASKKGA
jgi:hypothetical protein